MCGLCAALGSGKDWTDAAGRPEFERTGRKVTRRSEREARTALVNGVVGHYGLALQDWGGNSFVLSDASGKAENIYNLAGIWAAAERLIGGPCDPLDPGLLNRLERVGRDD
jgi:hypothetical protein